MSSYSVGITLSDNQPCILIDGDSVLCIFPSMPHGAEYAKAICDLLNAEQYVLPTNHL